MLSVGNPREFLNRSQLYVFHSILRGGNCTWKEIIISLGGSMLFFRRLLVIAGDFIVLSML